MKEFLENELSQRLFCQHLIFSAKGLAEQALLLFLVSISLSQRYAFASSSKRFFAPIKPLWLALISAAVRRKSYPKRRAYKIEKGSLRNLGIITSRTQFDDSIMKVVAAVFGIK